MRWIAFTTALIGIAQMMPASASAQTLLRGRVLEDSSTAPITSARVALLDMRFREIGQTFSDSAGQFVFDASPKGTYRIRVERSGFMTATTPVLRMATFRVVEGDTLTVEVRLQPHAILIAPLEVVANRRTREGSAIEGFRARKEAGFGLFISREEIEKRQPAATSDLLATVPGINLRTEGRGSRRVVYFARAASARSCPAQIYLDGFRLNRPTVRASMPGADGAEVFTIDEVVSPTAIEGIEVYSGVSNVPAEFISPEVRCGVVALWTRRGG